MANTRYIRRRRKALLITFIFTILVLAIIVTIIFSLVNKGKKNSADATASPFSYATTLPTAEATAAPTEDPDATIAPTEAPTNTATAEPTPTATVASVNKTMYVKVSADSKLNVRKTASTTADIVTTLNYGETVTAVEQSGDWYKIETSKDKTGYVMTKYLVSSKPDVATEMKKLWDKSGLYREGSTASTFSQLTVSYESDYKVKFTLTGTAGSATHTLSGTAYIYGNVATYTKDSSKVTLTLTSGKITIAVTKVTVPSGIVYNGTYSTTKPTASTTPLLDKGVLFSAAQETAFKNLTGTNYATFVSRCVSPSVIATGNADEKLTSFASSSSDKAVILITKDGKIWAAYTNAAGIYVVITNQAGIYPTAFENAIS